jgi:hypothetical protein
MSSPLLFLPSLFVRANTPILDAYSLLHSDKAVQNHFAAEILPFQPRSGPFHPIMPHGSKYGSSVVIVQERQYRPSSTYSVDSSASRSSGTASSYYSSAMDSRSSSSRSSSASNGAPDRTGTYRTGGSGTSDTIRRSWAIDTNTALKDGYVTTATHNNKGKRNVVIVHHNTKASDPDAPRSSDRYRS